MRKRLQSVLIAICTAVSTNQLAAQSVSPDGVRMRESQNGTHRMVYLAPDTASQVPRRPRAPYVIIGFLAGAALGGVVAARRTGHCDDWCLPGVAIAGGAVAGGTGGALVGLLIHDIAYRR